MNATSTLVLILVLAFAADRIAQAILFLLSYLKLWSRHFSDPRFEKDPERQALVKRRLDVVYTIIVGLFAGTAIWIYPELRIISMLAGPSTDALIDIVVTLLVVMGGSDLVGRILQISGIGEVGPAGQPAGRNQPIEITGRLVLENPDRLDASTTPHGQNRG